MQGPTKEKASIPASQPIKNRRRHLALWIAIALAFCLLASFAFLNYQCYKKYTMLLNKLHISLLHTQAHERHNATSNRYLLTAQRQNKQQIHQLKQAIFQRAEYFNLSETLYNLNLIKLNLINDSKLPQSIQLLNFAIQTLQQLPTEKYQQSKIKLEQALDILNTLQQNPTTEATRLINTLDNSVDKLPTQTEMPKKSLTIKPIPQQAQWKTYLKESYLALKNLFVLQYHPEPVAQMSTACYRSFARLQLQLYLTEASWALTHQAVTSYQSNLKNATIWVKTHYPQNFPETKTFLKTLENLQELDFHTYQEKQQQANNLIQNVIKQLSDTLSEQADPTIH